MARLLNRHGRVAERRNATKEERQDNQRRFGRIISIGERYIRNIAQSRRFTNDYERSGVEQARNRTYSQNTYMGTNAG